MSENSGKGLSPKIIIIIAAGIVATIIAVGIILYRQRKSQGDRDISLLKQWWEKTHIANEDLAGETKPTIVT